MGFNEKGKSTVNSIRSTNPKPVGSLTSRKMRHSTKSMAKNKMIAREQQWEGSVNLAHGYDKVRLVWRNPLC